MRRRKRAVFLLLMLLAAYMARARVVEIEPRPPRRWFHKKPKQKTIRKSVASFGSKHK